MLGKTKTQNIKKVSRYACDLSGETDLTPYMVIGATDSQHPIPEVLTGRIYCQPDMTTARMNP